MALYDLSVMPKHRLFHSAGVHGSVHHNINLIGITKKMRPCSRIIIPMCLNRSTCFERHTAHHQEPKNCNCSLWFYIRFWLSENLLFQCFLIDQHVSSDTPLIIRSSKTVIAASGFTYVFGCRKIYYSSVS